MKRTYLSIIGILLTSLIDLPIAHGQGVVGYNHIRAITLYEKVGNEVELLIEHFIPQVMRLQWDWDIQQKDIDQAIRKEYENLCAKETEETRKDMTYSECFELAREIRALAERESWTRALGRDLQILATGYEVKMSGYTSRVNDLSTQVTKIGKIWQSGIDKMTNPVKQRTIREANWSDYLTQDEQEEIETEIGSALMELIEQDSETSKQEVPTNTAILDKYFAAGWRYRHGLEEFSDRYDICNPNGDGDGTELELVNKRWCELEEALKKLKEKLPEEWEPPIAPSEQVIFNPLIPKSGGNVPYAEIYMAEDTGREPFGDGGEIPINIWAHDDDVGLIWKRPIEPVLPALISLAGEPILGGEYPEPPPIPEPGEGICSHPIGARGYLCRKIPNTRCPYPEEDDDRYDVRQPLEITIKLSACENKLSPPQTIRETESGPNICTQGGWRDPTGEDGDTPGEDRNLVPDECSNCVADLYCGNCPMGGETYKKNENGRIPICITNSLPFKRKYVIIHELVHAQQLCNKPPGAEFNTNTDLKSCCSVEYYPHIISCKAMADDDLLQDIDVTIEECAYMLSGFSCAQDHNACVSGTYEQQYFESLKEVIRAGDDEPSCQQSLEDLDARALSIKETLKRSCRPGCTVKYENTIGNNLCYLGQCIEESVEEHRLIPGNMPFTTGDQRAPWDSCEAPDSQIAALTTVPPQTPSKIPTYNPRQILQNVETAICQLNGYPRLAPPVLCATSSTRRIGLPLEGYSDTIENLISLQREAMAQAASMETSLGNIATRLGTEIRNTYLNKAIKELADVVGAARKIVEQIGTVPMTKTMCPRFHVGEENNGCQAFEYAN